MTPPSHYLHTIGECLVLWASGSDSTAAVDRLTVQDLKDKPRAKSVDSLIRWRRAYLACEDSATRLNLTLDRRQDSCSEAL